MHPWPCRHSVLNGCPLRAPVAIMALCISTVKTLLESSCLCWLIVSIGLVEPGEWFTTVPHKKHATQNTTSAANCVEDCSRSTGFVEGTNGYLLWRNSCHKASFIIMVCTVWVLRITLHLIVQIFCVPVVFAESSLSLSLQSVLPVC